ncbi:hypothetical protein GCM10009753_78990 [Streptantibioticus ferralitis]
MDSTSAAHHATRIPRPASGDGRLARCLCVPHWGTGLDVCAQCRWLQAVRRSTGPWLGVLRENDRPAAEATAPVGTVVLDSLRYDPAGRLLQRGRLTDDVFGAARPS